ncbi:MAG: flagellar basal body rod protein FlgC [Pirellulales bacterium]|nr:flagellar basal body rod protein FlgC [Pirellulales bacterium]
MYTALDISTSALVAQRVRLNTIASNMANLSTTHNELGEAVPFQPKFAVFQTDGAVHTPEGAAGVRVAGIETVASEPRWKYQPGHPDAQTQGARQGWVAYPDINLVEQSVDALEATRAYEANVGVIEMTKSLGQATLKILG